MRSLSNNTRRGLLAAAVVTVVLVVVLIFMLQDKGGGSGVPENPRDNISDVPGFQSLAEGGTETQLISDIEFEKGVICSGEDVMIRIKADASKFPEGSHPSSTVNGIPTNEAIVRFASPGERSYYVAMTDGRKGLDFRTGSIKVIPSETPECKSKPRIILYSRPLSQTTYRFEILDTQAVKAEMFRFDFGDGTVEDTPQKTVDHNFITRAQDKESSVFQVRVSAVQNGIPAATARVTVIVANTYYSTLRIGSPQLPVEHARYFKKTSNANGSNLYEADIYIINPDSQSVKLERASVSMIPCGAGDPVEEEKDAGALLDQTILMAHKKTATKLRVNSANDLCAIRITFQGDSEPPRSGKNAESGSGTIAKTTAFVDLSRNTGDTTGSDKLDSMIQLEKARLLLSRENVSDEDLKTLQSRGLLIAR